MKLDDCIKGRRSVRDYRVLDIPLNIIGEIIDSAKYAPSAGNLQNWKILIVKDKKKKEQIVSLCGDQLWMLKASAFLVICNEKTKMLRYYPNRGAKYSTQGCAMLMQNIMLKSYDLGVGSCLVGAFQDEELKELLSIPADVDVEGIITLGYVESKRVTVPKKHPIETISYFDKWGEKKKEPSKKIMDKKEVFKERIKDNKNRLRYLIRK